MKSLLKIFIIIFSLAMSFLLDPSTLQAQPIEIGYIQNIKKETVVLVSNNILNGEIQLSFLYTFKNLKIEKTIFYFKIILYTIFVHFCASFLNLASQRAFRLYFIKILAPQECLDIL